MDDSIIPKERLQARREAKHVQKRKAVALDRPFVTPNADQHVYLRGMNEGEFLQLLQSYLPAQAGVRITAKRHDIEIWFPPHFSRMYKTKLLDVMNEEFGKDMVHFHGDSRASIFTLSHQILRDEWGIEGFKQALSEGELANLVPLPKVHSKDIELLEAHKAEQEQSR